MLTTSSSLGHFLWLHKQGHHAIVLSSKMAACTLEDTVSAAGLKVEYSAV